MKLIILGSGTSVPHPKRSSSAYWIETADASILLDCSASSIHRMAQEGLDWANLDAIWISHFHLDHCGGTGPYLFATKHAPETQERTKPLTIFGGPGVREIIAKIDAVNDYGLLRQPFPVEVVEVSPLQQWTIVPGIEATAFSTPHTPESLALHLTYGEKTLVYTADTGFSETLAAIARDADLLLMECSFVKNKPVEIHLELAEAMYLIRKAAPKRVVLTHLYPEWDGLDLPKEAAKFSPRTEVLEAQDGMRIEV